MVTWPVIYVCLHILHTHTPKKKIHKRVVEWFEWLMLFDRIFHLCMPTLMTLSCTFRFVPILLTIRPLPLLQWNTA